MSDTHNCHGLVHYLSEYVDGTLSPALCAELEKHLDECENCRIVVNTLKKTIEIYHETAVDLSLPADVRKRLFLRLHLEDFLSK